MATRKVSRKLLLASSSKSISKKSSTVKSAYEPRKSTSKSKLPGKTESQNTLTQIQWIPRSAGQTLSEEEAMNFVEIARPASSHNLKFKDGPGSGKNRGRDTKDTKPQVSPGKRRFSRKRLKKGTFDKTLTQIGYVTRDQVKHVDADEEMDFIEVAQEPQMSKTDDISNGSSHREMAVDIAASYAPTRLVLEAGHRKTNYTTFDSDDETEPQVSIKPERTTGRGTKRKEMEDTAPKKPAKIKRTKTLANRNDASSIDESDYADDESPKRKTRRRVSPKENGPIASRLRPRNVPVSYMYGHSSPKLITRSRPNDYQQETAVDTSHAESGQSPMTPVKRLPFEIPSSQSPATTPLSIRSRPPSQAGHNSPLHSPLTEVSGNSSSLLKSVQKDQFTFRGKKPTSNEQGQRANKTLDDLGKIQGLSNLSKLTNKAKNNPPVLAANSNPPSGLPELDSILRSARTTLLEQEAMFQSMIFSSVTTTENELSDVEFKPGLETQAAPVEPTSEARPEEDGGQDHESGQNKSQLYSQQGTHSARAETAVARQKNPHHLSINESDQGSSSPSWVSDNRFQGPKPTQRPSQISTQDQSQVSSAVLLLTQDEGSTKENKEHGPPGDRVDRHSRQFNLPDSLLPSTQCLPALPSSPKVLDLQTQTESETETQKTIQKIRFQVWDSSDSRTREILTASQLLPASLMEPLPQPPQWSQESFSDGDWI